MSCAAPAPLPFDTEVKLAARAILIVLVVIGHNQLFREHFYYSAYILIYSFHVGSFFLLATLSPPRAMSRAVLQGMALRFYKPFLVFTMVYGVLYLPIYLRPYDHDGVSWVSDMALATGVATSPLLDVATGLKLLWFLPAFMSFCALYNIQGRLPLRLQAAFWLLAAMVNATITMMPVERLTFVPLGLGVSLFLLFPALLFMHLKRVITTLQGRLTVILLFAATSVMIVALRMEVILSDFRMPSVLTPGRLLLCDMQLILGSLCCLVVARAIAGSKAVRWIGERSLYIYLLHAPFNIVIATLLERMFGNALPWPLAIGITVGGTITASAVAARLVEASQINPLVFSARRRPLSSSVRMLREAWR